MKIRTTRYIIKEGILNAYRNKLMSLASISIVVASLLIFGIFLLFTINLNYNMKGLKELPEMEVFCKPELDDFQVARIEDNIKQNPAIKDYKRVDKKEAFETAKEMYGEYKNALDGLDESFLPVSFKIRLKNPEEGIAAIEQFKKITGVDTVTYPQKVTDVITKISRWVQLVSGFLITVLLVISMFIIANTIKLTVFARRKEISIMKYIGATDWFIRWPFIIEGVIIGLIGAIAAFIIITYGYGAVCNAVEKNIGQEMVMIIKMVSSKEVGTQIIGLFSVIGVSIGILGSVISIRKYLHV